jgi:manganese/zinc/iron transport system permease protein
MNGIAATLRVVVLLSCQLIVWCGPVLGESRTDLALEEPPLELTRLADDGFSWPSWSDCRRVLSLRDYNTRVVVIGTMVLGCATGLVGSFTLLRRRALMGDAISHATLPGICIAFIVATRLGLNGKALPYLLLGATVTGLLGAGMILFLRRQTRLKEDAALGTVLSVFFGAGVALLAVVQGMNEGHAAGLESFVYGKAASLASRDVQLIVAAAFLCSLITILLFKELQLLCFDAGFAGAQGLPTLLLDATLMSLVVIVCLVGLQAVGSILIIAALIIPAASARFWTDDMKRMVQYSAGIGAVSGWLGATISALLPNVPSGATIVLVCTGIFFVSLLFGTRRGVVSRWIEQYRLNRSVARQHLLRTMYELLEAEQGHQTGAALDRRNVQISDLLNKRSWSASSVRRTIHRAVREREVFLQGDAVRFTPNGLQEAARLTRQHRLWELYLITYADVAPGNVDRDADAIEHVLEPAIVAELESLLQKRTTAVPASPHQLIEAGADEPSSPRVGRAAE